MLLLLAFIFCLCEESEWAAFMLFLYWVLL